MLVAEFITIAASGLLLVNELRNLDKSRMLNRFVNEVHIIRDRLDAIEQTVIKIYKG